MKHFILLPIFSIFLTFTVFAQALPDSGQSHAIPYADHLYLTAPSGELALEVQPGAFVCLDGSTHAACVTWSILSQSLEVSADIQATSLTTTSSDKGIVLRSGSKFCVDGVFCGNSISYEHPGKVVFSSTLAAPVVKLEYSSLGTCSSDTVGQLKSVKNSGFDGQLCYCLEVTSSGEFQWKNLLQPTLSGTDTVCPLTEG